VVTNVNLMLDRVTGKSRGFAFVEFSTAATVAVAIVIDPADHAHADQR